MTTPIDTTRLRADAERITTAELRALREMLADGHPCDITNAMAYNALPALLDEVERLRARPTWERVLRIANGCTDYGGGHHGADHEVYQHGIWTVCNVLKNACEQGDKPDMQLRVVEAIGADAMRATEPDEGGMTTPIDTTRLRVLLDAVDATEHAYHMCDPVYDERRPAAWHAMDEAQRAFREAWASTSPRALLDEVERLRAIFTDAGQGEHDVLALVEHYQKQAIDADGRTALAYPRALQAAADVVLNADLSLFDDEASGLGWLDDIANNILDLTEEQIDAFDAAQREPEEGGTR